MPYSNTLIAIKAFFVHAQGREILKFKEMDT
jgi:hypothetical protein